MKNEAKRTGIFAGVAAVLVLLVFATAPRAREAAVFAAQGGEFYPAFKDPLKVAALEVHEPDELGGGFKPFRVQVHEGQWTIPSHSNYPADGKDRLAKTAASVMDLKKDRLASDNPKDHAELGVGDPGDPNLSAKGARGKRVKLFDGAGTILADYIFGKETKEGPEYRYVRVPDQKQTWAVKVKPDISVKFEDWVETDLLKTGSASLKKVVIDKYSFDVTEQKFKDKSVYTAARDDSAAPWRVGEMKESEEVNTETLTTLTSTLSGLKLTGVRPKPPVVAAAQDLTNLGKMPRETLMAVARALGGKGFYVVVDKDRFAMISSEGEMSVSFDDGVVYTLRFGDVLVGSGDEVSAGLPEEKEPKDDKKDPKKDEKKDKGGTENRYLMVSARYDESLAPAAPVEPKPYVADPAKKPEEQNAEEAKSKKDKEEYDTKKKDWEKKKADGKKRAEELTKRFAPWYYVISADAFKKLRVERSALVKAKEVPKDEKKPEEPKKPEPPKDEKKPEPPKAPEAPKDEKKPEAPKDEKKPEAPKEEKKP